MADPVVSITSGVPTSGTGTITTLGQVVAPQGASTSTGESGTSGPVRGPLIQGATLTSAPTYTTGTVNPLTTTLAGALRVDGSGATQPVSGTFWQTTQPISGTVTANQGGAPWSMKPDGTSWALTSTSANVNVTNTVPVSGTFWQATQPVSAASLPLPTGAATSANQPTNAAAASTTSGQTGNLAMGAVTTAAPSYTTATSNNLSLTTSGALRVDGSAVTQPVSGTVTAAQATAANLNATVTGANAFATTFPATGLAAGAQYLASPPVNSNGTMVALQTDINGNLKINTSSLIAQTTWNSATALNSVYNLTINSSVVWNSLCGTIVCGTTMTAGAVTFEESYDFGTTWVSIPVQRLVNPVTGQQINNPLTLAASTNFPWEVVCTSTNYVRLRLSTVIVGTGSAVISTTQESGANAVTVFQPVAGNLNVAAVCSGDTTAGSTDAGSPVKTGGRANVGTTYPTAVTNGQRVNAMYDKTGKQIATGALREMKGKQYTTITTNTSTTVVTGGAAGTFNDVYAIVVTNTSATATSITFNDGAANQLTLACPAGDTRGFTVPVDSAIPQTNAAGAWTATAATAVTSLLVTMLFVVNT